MGEDEKFLRVVLVEMIFIPVNLDDEERVSCREVRRSVFNRFIFFRMTMVWQVFLKLGYEGLEPVVPEDFLLLVCFLLVTRV